MNENESVAASLVALTEEAEHALGGVRNLTLNRFPVTFGRERRSSNGAVGSHGAVAEDLRRREAAPVNDIYLREIAESRGLQISGAHFAIEYDDHQFVLIDRGSACGTIVSGRHVGGQRVGGRAELRDGDEVVVGNSRSRYVFRFTVIGDELGRS